jgi:hypothetical protein
MKKKRKREKKMEEESEMNQELQRLGDFLGEHPVELYDDELAVVRVTLNNDGTMVVDFNQVDDLGLARLIKFALNQETIESLAPSLPNDTLAELASLDDEDIVNPFDVFQTRDML